jgi:AcrR family transcriptional regulator
LQAAEELFCEKGFDATSVRDITKAAGCNLAAVNYYFGGKENLYNAIFQKHLQSLRNVRITGVDRVMSQPQPSLEDLIRSFATAFLEPLMDQSSGQRLIKLMIREMSDPRLPKKMFIEELAEPTLSVLSAGIARICPRLSQEKIVLSIISIIGQLVHIIRLNEMFDFSQIIDMHPPRVADMIDHIVEFSAAGIRAADKGSG